ncbi:hypothetical protein EYF80_032919 [Liparis tanakae]|uniref:Uncharacterized protein n=1 Tax=Liparis tanakae TaxID=230148 RepID=A0A4Z2GVP2_9TELE|nr:hypothetical protein EYF80_032919 [Liparis tanakae]
MRSCCVASWCPALIPAAALDGLSWDLLREQPLFTSPQRSSKETSLFSSREAAGCCLDRDSLHSAFLDRRLFSWAAIPPLLVNNKLKAAKKYDCGYCCKHVDPGWNLSSHRASLCKAGDCSHMLLATGCLPPASRTNSLFPAQEAQQARRAERRAFQQPTLPFHPPQIQILASASCDDVMRIRAEKPNHPLQDSNKLLILSLAGSRLLFLRPLIPATFEGMRRAASPHALCVIVCAEYGSGGGGGDEGGVGGGGNGKNSTMTVREKLVIQAPGILLVMP